ncbi:MAG TPA: MFS transporter, partial [Allocoleopsis sp.]
MQNNVNSQQPPLNYTTKLAYGIGDLGGSITGNILLFFLSPFLTDVVGLAPSLAGLSQLVGKFWDAINDPIVGVLSDRTKSKLGRRYPWMIYGAIPFGIFFFLQWIIPHFSDNNNINQWGLFWYYTIISIAFNSFYTVVNLPYTALTPELTDDYNERTSLNSFRFFFSIGGSILSVIIFGIINNIWGSNPPLHYLINGGICAFLSVIPLYICVWGTRDRTLSSPIQNAQINHDNHTSFWQQLKTALSNKPFLFVLGIYLFSWLSMQLTATILPYFVVSYMRLNNQYVVPVVLAVQGTAMIMLFIWSKVSERFGKKE